MRLSQDRMGSLPAKSKHPKNWWKTIEANFRQPDRKNREELSVDVAAIAAAGNWRRKDRTILIMGLQFLS